MGKQSQRHQPQSPSWRNGDGNFHSESYLDLDLCRVFWLPYREQLLLLDSFCQKFYIVDTENLIKGRLNTSYVSTISPDRVSLLALSRLLSG